MEGRITSHAEHGSCNTITVLHNECLVCHKSCTVNFLALGEPYMASVHRSCAPFFDFDGNYPHPYPVATYLNVQQRRTGSPEKQINRMRRRSLDLSRSN